MTPGPEPDWDACFNSDDEHVKIKKANTIEFFEARQKAGVFGAVIGPEQRELVKHWRSMYDNRDSL